MIEETEEQAARMRKHEYFWQNIDDIYYNRMKEITRAEFVFAMLNPEE